ncbi:putative eka-like protein [Erysiphe necator]|uniref:Putative eka-like protein n=1 Tax=Uncinula necator TaxID=52586 RepID=A0A0B1P7Z0_UNCNE|nr:putative eka-like protein [Erysiphe necator]
MNNSDHNFLSSPTPQVNTSTQLRAEASDPMLSKSGRLHPSLLSIANAMQQVEKERRGRMGLAQEFLEIIDAWAKGKTGTKTEAIIVPLIQKLAPTVTAFATGAVEGALLVPTSTHKAKNFQILNEKPIHNNIQLDENKQNQRNYNTSSATLARKSAKLPQPPLSAIPLPKKPGGNKKETESNDPKEDKRLFLRLRPDHAWRKLSPIAIKKMITEKAGVAATAITALYSVRSGYAIECVSGALRHTILTAGKSLGDTDAIIEAASDWASLLVPNVPLSIRNLDSNVIVTSEMVANECLAVCVMLPIQLRPMKSSTGQFYTSWLIHFKKRPVDIHFRLFDESGPAMAFKRHRPIEQCPKCWGFHSTRFCEKDCYCGKCKGSHETEKCEAKIPKCSNFNGPYMSTNVKCMARPRRQGEHFVPRTPAELKIIKERGNRDFQAALAEARKADELNKEDRTPEGVTILEENMQDS